MRAMRPIMLYMLHVAWFVGVSAKTDKPVETPTGGGKLVRTLGTISVHIGATWRIRLNDPCMEASLAVPAHLSCLCVLVRYDTT